MDPPTREWDGKFPRLPDPVFSRSGFASGDVPSYALEPLPEVIRRGGVSSSRPEPAPFVRRKLRYDDVLLVDGSTVLCGSIQFNVSKTNFNGPSLFHQEYEREASIGASAFSPKVKIDCPNGVVADVFSAHAAQSAVMPESVVLAAEPVAPGGPAFAPAPDVAAADQVADGVALGPSRETMGVGALLNRFLPAVGSSPADTSASLPCATVSESAVGLLAFVRPSGVDSRTCFFVEGKPEVLRFGDPRGDSECVQMDNQIAVSEFIMKHSEGCVTTAGFGHVLEKLFKHHLLPLTCAGYLDRRLRQVVGDVSAAQKRVGGHIRDLSDLELPAPMRLLSGLAYVRLRDVFAYWRGFPRTSMLEEASRGGGKRVHLSISHPRSFAWTTFECYYRGVEVQVRPFTEEKVTCMSFYGVPLGGSHELTLTNVEMSLGGVPRPLPPEWKTARDVPPGSWLICSLDSGRIVSVSLACVDDGRLFGCPIISLPVVSGAVDALNACLRWFIDFDQIDKGDFVAFLAPPRTSVPAMIREIVSGVRTELMAVVGAVIGGMAVPFLISVVPSSVRPIGAHYVFDTLSAGGSYGQYLRRLGDFCRESQFFDD